MALHRWLDTQAPDASLQLACLGNCVSICTCVVAATLTHLDPGVILLRIEHIQSARFFFCTAGLLRHCSVHLADSVCDVNKPLLCPLVCACACICPSPHRNSWVLTELIIQHKSYLIDHQTQRLYSDPGDSSWPELLGTYDGLNLLLNNQATTGECFLLMGW